MPWYQGQVFLGTWGPQDRPSSVKDWTWPSPRNNRAATLDENMVPPGGVGNFSFWIFALDNNNTYYEHFNLVDEGVTWMNDTGLVFGFRSTQ